VRDISLRWFLVLLLAVCVPFQAALAVSVAQHAALEQCHDGHDGHDGHGKASGSHCSSCCTSAAIASAPHPLSASPAHGAAHTVPGHPPLGDLPGVLDRPPRAL
jgi:hypothetical protein